MAKRKPRRTITQRATTMAAETAPVSEVEAGSKRLDLAGEYHYVIRDLRQIALIAAGLIAALIALSFFL